MKGKKKEQISSVWFEMAKLHVCVAQLSWFLSRKLSGADDKNTKSKNLSTETASRAHPSEKPAQARAKANESYGVNERPGSAWGRVLVLTAGQV